MKEEMKKITDSKKKQKLSKLDNNDDIVSENLDEEYNPEDLLDKSPKEKYKDYKILDFKAFKEFLSGVKKFLFGVTLEKSEYTEKNYKVLNKQIKFPIMFGLISIGVTVGFFGIWAGVAPLDSAVTAEAFVTLDNQKKVIQPLEAGVVEKILVKDGDIVEKDQDLIILNQVRASAELQKALWQLRYASAVDIRLQASMKLLTDLQRNLDDKNFVPEIELDFSSKYLQDSDPEVLRLIQTQKDAFYSFKDFLLFSLHAFNKDIEGIKHEIISVEEAIKSDTEAAQTYEKEYARRNKLYQDKLETLDRLSSLKIELQKYKGSVLQNKSKIAAYEQRIAKAESEKRRFLEEYNVKLAEEYKRNHAEYLVDEGGYLHAKDSYERTVIKAPNSGIVKALAVHTVGSAIRHAEPIMEIVPQDDNLVLEAYIQTKDIDSIYVGSEVKIQLAAYRARTMPRVSGEVTYISADRFDPQPGNSAHQHLGPMGYYKAKISVSQEELDKVNMDIKLTPGMPATVFIVKGTRTFAEYLYAPIKDSFHRAFKEA